MQRPHRSRRRMLAGGVVLALAAAGLVTIPAVTANAAPVDLGQCPWMDTSKTPSERAQLLLDASTKDQKYRWLDEQSANSPTVTTFGRGATAVTYPVQVACTPTIVYTDGPDGIRSTAGVTAFPSEVAMGATWDTSLNYAKGTAVAEEGYAKGKNGVLGPGISSSRTPLAGRTPEYLGEDSLLSGTLAAEQVNGMQTGDPDTPVLTSIKHYVANEQETARQTSSSNIDQRTFEEVYNLPFGIVSAESQPTSVMCSYNQLSVGGSVAAYSCENPELTTGLKGEDGFTGFVVSDFGAVHSTAASLKAGLDQELNVPKYYTPALIDAAIAADPSLQSAVDAAEFRVVRALIATGLFDHALPSTVTANASTDAHKAISKQAAEEGSVLLKNQKAALPLDVTAGEKIALIGPTASATATNGVSATSVCSQGAVGRANTMTCDGLVAPDTAFTARAAQDGASVVVDNGSDLTQAAATAASADVAVVFGYQRMGEFSDVSDLHLQGNGDALISAVAAAAKKTIVVLETGSAVEMPWLNSVDSVVEAWYPGDQQGPALADLLFGDTDFSGKLPMTFPKSIDDIPANVTPAASSGITQVDYSEGLEVGYKWYEAQGIQPQFAFGHGLSYTSFGYDGLTVTNSRTSSGDLVSHVSVTVTNTGDVAGTEVPQVYLTLPSSADEPGKRLVGFDRVSLEPGQSQTVSVDVDSSSAAHPFGVFDTAQDAWTNIAGRYTFSVGSASDDIALSTRQDLEFGATAPVVSVSASPASADGQDGWYTSPVTVTASATDDVDATPSLEVDIDGAGWFATDGSVPVLTDGTHELQFRATDDSGNVSDVVSTTVKLDRVAPQVVASSDSTTRTVSLEAQDAASGVARIEYATPADPDTWTEYTAPIALGRTATTVLYRAVDVAGNVSDTETFDYTPGVTVPSVGLSVSRTSAPVGVAITLKATAPADTVGRIQFLDGTRVISTTTPVNGAATITIKPAVGTHVYSSRLIGDPVYAPASSMSTTVHVTKATPSTVSITTTSVRAGTTQRLAVVVGKLDNGQWPAGTVYLSVNGKRAGEATLSSAAHGHVTVALNAAHRQSGTFLVKAQFVPKSTATGATVTSRAYTVRVVG